MSLKKTCRLEGFTLIELLVVVAIIAMLISILLPSLSRARESAKAVACLANMRQQGMAMFMFANDHDGLTPPIQNMDKYNQSPRDMTYTWQGEMSPYLSMPQDDDFLYRIRNDWVEEFGKNVFHCPTTLVKKVYTPLATGATASYQYYSYGMSIIVPYYTYDRDWNYSKSHGVSIGSIRSTSGAAAVVETSYWYISRHWYINSYGLMPHSDKTNFLFYDGHADTVSYDAVPKTDADIFWSGGAY